MKTNISTTTEPFSTSLNTLLQCEMIQQYSNEAIKQFSKTIYIILYPYICIFCVYIVLVFLLILAIFLLLLKLLKKINKMKESFL